MSEVALVAAITGGASVLTSAVTAAVTWAVSRNSSSVELAKVTAENERLQQTNREEERRNRQGTYHDFINAMHGVYRFLGMKVKEPWKKDPFEQYSRLSSGVMLFGPPSVRQKVMELNRIYNRLWLALQDEEQRHPEKPSEECWASATSGLKEEFNVCAKDLIALMHADVTHGIAEDPEPGVPTRAAAAPRVGASL